MGGERYSQAMPRRLFVFDIPDRFATGTIGEPGNRAFFLQARDGRRVVSVGLEKAQVAVLADRLGKLLVVLRSAQSSTVAQATPQPKADDPPTPIQAKASPPEDAGPVWGGDVSRALGGGHAAPDTEVRLYLGGRQVEVYKY